jgi:hypothetical protein
MVLLPLAAKQDDRADYSRRLRQVFIIPYIGWALAGLRQVVFICADLGTHDSQKYRWDSAQTPSVAVHIDTTTTIFVTWDSEGSSHIPPFQDRHGIP